MRQIFLLIALLLSAITTGQQVLPPEKMAIDDSLDLALIHTTELDEISSSSVLKKGKRTFTVSITDQDTLKTNKFQLLDDHGKTFTTYVTSIPLIQIHAPKGIVNEPKRMARITYTDADTSFTSYAGIELRGSSSLVFAKKNYDLNFYKDSLGIENANVRLAGMRSDDDWILDGLFNEPLRMRSQLSLKLWNEIYQPYYLDREPKAKAGVKAAYADVFVNGKYQGVFLLQEQVDRKLTRIKKIKDDRIRGELFQGASYDGAVTFDSLPQKKNYLPFWGGYDIKYPVPTNTYWDNLYPFTDFVMNSADDAFAKGIGNQFHLENAIDYFLFINAVRAPDNLGKNLFLIRYDENEPYFYAPWDLDGSFGTIFNGKRVSTIDDFLQNGLLRRLIATDDGSFVSAFQERWTVLRHDILATKKLLKQQESVFTFLTQNHIFEREARAWKGFNYNVEGLEYMQQWTQKRLNFLDEYIASLPKIKQ